MKTHPRLSVFFALLAAMSARAAEPPGGPRNQHRAGRGPAAAAACPRDPEFLPSAMCRNCHQRIYDQQIASMHEQSWSNPVFQAQYLQDMVPRAYDSLDLFKETRSCSACHMPVAHAQSRARVVTKEMVPKDMGGVTCDACHTIAGIDGDTPGNGNYVMVPGLQKFGPFRTASTWHHEFSELQTRSEFCATCHNARNRHGLEIKSTYTEWKASVYAEKGIQCQDCHMNEKGFLVDGVASFESGHAAGMSVGHAPRREKLGSHHFPGARTHTQMDGALTLTIEPPKEGLQAGRAARVELLVDNHRTGHKMPSGSAELRFMWIEFQATAGGASVDLMPVEEAEVAGYGVTSASPDPLDPLGDSVKPGRRVYRALFNDSKGRMTGLLHEAAKVRFDNRLEAAEVRREAYVFAVPAADKVVLSASLYYAPYPVTFARRLRLPPAEAVLVARCERVLPIAP